MLKKELKKVTISKKYSKKGFHEWVSSKKGFKKWISQKRKLIFWVLKKVSLLKKVLKKVVCSIELFTQKNSKLFLPFPVLKKFKTTFTFHFSILKHLRMFKIEIMKIESGFWLSNGCPALLCSVNCLAAIIWKKVRVKIVLTKKYGGIKLFNIAQLIIWLACLKKYSLTCLEKKYWLTCLRKILINLPWKKYRLTCLEKNIDWPAWKKIWLTCLEKNMIDLPRKKLIDLPRKKYDWPASKKIWLTCLEKYWLTCLEKYRLTCEKYWLTCEKYWLTCEKYWLTCL